MRQRRCIRPLAGGPMTVAGIAPLPFPVFGAGFGLRVEGGGTLISFFAGVKSVTRILLRPGSCTNNACSVQLTARSALIVGPNHLPAKGTTSSLPGAEHTHTTILIRICSRFLQSSLSLYRSRPGEGGGLFGVFFSLFPLPTSLLFAPVSS